MRRLRVGLGLAVASAAMTAPTWAQQPGGFSPGAVVQPLPNDEGAELRRHLTTLAANPRSLDALIGAGRAAVDAGDGEAAVSFFDRAREIAPGNPRVQAGMGSALALVGQPQAALGMFAQARTAGAPEPELAGDRGLAYDLIGDTGRAQQDYLLALRYRETPAVRRRMALSLAISGEQAAALRLLDPQLRRNDRSAWRAQAFVLALTGDTGGAGRTAQSMMPAGAASAMAPFLARLATLSPGQKAHAVHLGRFPAGSGSAGTTFRPPADPAALAWAMGGTVPVRPAGPIQTAAVSQPSATRPPVARFSPAPSASATARPSARTSERRPTPGDIRRDATGWVERPRPRSRPEREESRISAASSNMVPAQMTEQAQRPPVTQPAPSRFAATPVPVPIPTQPRMTEPAVVAPGPAAFSATPAPSSSGAISSQELGTQAATPALPPVSTPTTGMVATNLPAGPPVSSLPAPSLITPSSASPGFSIAALGENAGRSLVTNPAPPVQDLAPRTSEPPAPSVPVPAAPTPTPEVEGPASAERPGGGLSDIAALVNALPAETASRPAPARSNTPSPTVASRPRAAATTRTQKPVATHGARIWVQIATAADRSSLPREYARLKGMAPDQLGRRNPYTAPLRATNRLLVGPFATNREAQAFVNELAKEEISAFAWTSEEGQEIARLPAR